ncbi:MAG: hypothetical protein HQL49_07035 [Gammaproteobacteria bacterium]|nr:hypothetical protein [Gammaproteobacteria bacterium]
MNPALLSLTKAPPLSVPLRFFLTAPLFGLVAAITLFFLAWQGVNPLAQRWSPAVLLLVHALTLGYLTMVMVGALSQLMPVLIGARLENPLRVSRVMHLLLLLGVLLLLLGFALQIPWLLASATLLLGLALSQVVVVTLYALLRSSSRHATVYALIAAVLALSLTWGVIALLLYQGNWWTPLAHPYTHLHIVWGVLGWMGMLLMGIAYQVVPMFQITPEFPQRWRQALVPLLFAALLLLTLAVLLELKTLAHLAHLMLGLGFAAFALLLWRLLRQRMRRIADVTYDYWLLAMASLLLAAVVAVIGEVAALLGFAVPAALWQGWALLLLLAGVLLAAIAGMLLKIVPFLVWLHLNHRFQRAGAFQGNIPNMRQIIPYQQMRRQFTLQLAALLTLLVALLPGWSGWLPEALLFLPQWLLMVAALLWAALFLLQFVVMVTALRLYRHHLRLLPGLLPEH